MIKKVRINTDLITEWNSFHDIFKITFGFPDFYGRNMDAWIDCMTDIDDKETGMTRVWINKTDTLVIELTNSKQFKERCPDIYIALLECAAFVNFRKIENKEQAMIAIALE
jgi:RNAse (barnase) inhibitor barstar